MAGFSFSDTTHQNVGDLVSRATGGSVTFGITGSQFQTTVIAVAGIAASALLLWWLLQRRK